MFDSAQRNIHYLRLSVTDLCNLRCRYCFASTGDFGTGHRMTMDFDTAKRAIGVWRPCSPGAASIPSASPAANRWCARA